MNEQEISKMLKDRQAMIATPMYGSICRGEYTHSMLKLACYYSHYGGNFCASFELDDCNITKGRNTLVVKFMESNCTHLLFIDGDILFEPKDVMDLLFLCDPESDKDVVVGVCPKRSINWKTLSKAVENGVPEEELKMFTGDYAIKHLPGVDKVSAKEPFEIMCGGTGFMMIQRRVIEKYCEEHPEKGYFHMGGWIPNIFETGIHEESQEFISSDYVFCRKMRELGFKVWACPWLNLGHCASYVYNGCYSKLSVLK
jgi:hypothetical protein